MQAVNVGDDVHVVGVNGFTGCSYDWPPGTWKESTWSHIEPEKDRRHLNPEGVDIVVLTILLQNQVYLIAFFHSL